MTTSKQIENLWDKMQEFIDQAYKAEPTGPVITPQQNTPYNLSQALRDYTSDSSWTRALVRLADRETVNEKQHRRGAPSGYHAPISAACAAKLLLCGNFADGSHLHEMPSALTFITWRTTAAEANLLGWLCREFVSEEFRAKVKELDYAQIMRAA